MKRKTIRKHGDFFCETESLTVRSGLFLVKAKPSRIFDDARYGLIVSKKEFKLATQRNRAKRLMREWIAHNENFMRPDYDYIFIVNHDVLESTRENGRYEVKWSLKKIAKIIEQYEN